jgi:hypothetical protein
MAALALPLGACGLADSRSSLPEFLRVKEADPAPPEAPPDVGALVSKEIDTIFLPSSYPHDVRVSQPHHDLRGNAWIACVRAELTSATGTPLGSQTYRVMITNGDISDRRRVDQDDNCASEHYAPVTTANSRPNPRAITN